MIPLCDLIRKYSLNYVIASMSEAISRLLRDFVRNDTGFTEDLRFVIPRSPLVGRDMLDLHMSLPDSIGQSSWRTESSYLDLPVKPEDDFFGVITKSRISVTVH